MDRKTIIAFSFATNRLGAGLVGLVYYNPEIHSDNYNHINIPKLGHYVHEYNLRDTGSVSHIRFCDRWFGGTDNRYRYGYNSPIRNVAT